MLKVEKLQFSFPNSEPIFTNLSFELKKGDTLAVLGESGAGKTTLAFLIKRIIPKLMKGKVIGSIQFHGKDVKQYSFSELNRRIGMMMQNPDSYMFTSSVYSEILFGVKNFGLPESKVSEILEYLGISEFADRPPQNLSSGQKQLVSLAMVLSTEPELIILDEPDLHLDYKSEQRLIAILKQLKEEKRISFIIIGHNATIPLAIADQALFLGQDGYKFGPMSDFVEETKQVKWKSEFYM